MIVHYIYVWDGSEYAFKVAVGDFGEAKWLVDSLNSLGGDALWISW